MPVLVFAVVCDTWKQYVKWKKSAFTVLAITGYTLNTANVALLACNAMWTCM
jgi:hypothetical protein